MIICKTLKELKDLKNTVNIGFIPTMGALHIGHEALIKEAKKNNEQTWVSIFVNPLQFNDKKDFQVYPNKIEADLTIKENTHPISFVANIVINEGIGLASGYLQIDRSKYGIKYKSKSWFPDIGDRFINDTFELYFNLLSSEIK